MGDDKQYSIIKPRNESSPSLLLFDLQLKIKMLLSTLFLTEDLMKDNIAPGIDLPVSGFCRSRFHTFKEYHTDKDNLDYISEKD